MYSFDCYLALSLKTIITHFINNLLFLHPTLIDQPEIQMSKKIFIVDITDEKVPFFKLFFAQDEVEWVPVDQSNSYELAEVLHDKKVVDPIICINAHLKKIDTGNQEGGCLQCLKEIRLNENYKKEKSNIQNAFVLIYSFLNAEELIRIQTQNIFLFTPNTVFLHLPHDIIRGRKKNILQKVKQFQESDKSLTAWELRPYFKSDLQFKLNKNRHSYANLFGALMMVYISNWLCENKAGGQPLHLSVLNIALKEVLYIYSKKLNNLEFEDFQKVLVDEALADIQQQYHATSGNPTTPKIALIDDEGDQILMSKELLLNTKIGWKNIYQEVLNKHVIIDDLIHENGLDESAISNSIKNNDYKCILLDLQLHEKEEKGILNKTGFKWLKKWREEFPGLPIIITTMSLLATMLAILLLKLI